MKDKTKQIWNNLEGKKREKDKNPKQTKEHKRIIRHAEEYIAELFKRGKETKTT